jgi:hypothetical protein
VSRDSCCYNVDDDDDDGYKETDTLLRKTTLPNMTHIDDIHNMDDISYADEERVALNV